MGIISRSRQRGLISRVVPLDAPLELVFERAHDASDDEGWIPDTSIKTSPPPGCEEFTLTWREAAVRGGRQLRTQWMESFDVSKLSEVFCPEVLCHPQIGVLCDGVEECGIERLIAPGDAEVFERLSLGIGLATHKVSTLGVAGDKLLGRSADGGCAPSKMRRYRITVRRDFPKEGECTTVMMPRHLETGELLIDWGDTSSVVVHVRPHSDPGKSIITLLEQLPPIPEWAEHLAMSKLVRRFKTHRIAFLEMVQMRPRLFENDLSKHVSSAASYVVANLQKCCRGGPLLPIGAEDGLTYLGSGNYGFSTLEWEQFDIKRLHISIYLNEFLRRMGFAETIFHDSLYGVRLVHFQAVVQRGAWERVKVPFGEAFRLQRSAFRHFLGGRLAPELQIGAKPRLLTPAPLNKDLSTGDPAPACEPRAEVAGLKLHSFDPLSCSAATALTELYDPIRSSR